MFVRSIGDYGNQNKAFQNDVERMDRMWSGKREVSPGQIHSHNSNLFFVFLQKH